MLRESQRAALYQCQCVASMSLRFGLGFRRSSYRFLKVPYYPNNKYLPQVDLVVNIQLD